MIDPRIKRRKHTRFVRKLMRSHHWPRNIDQLSQEDFNRLFWSHANARRAAKRTTIGEESA